MEQYAIDLLLPVNPTISPWTGDKIVKKTLGQVTRRGLRGFSKPPIIIGGCPRSGTSLLLSIISAHPNIYAIRDEAWAFYDTDDLAEFSRFLDNLLWPHIPPGAEKTYDRWCEKTPRNIFAFANIMRFFGPGTRLINLVRDGRDVIISRHPHDPTKYWVEDWMWIWSVNEGLLYRDHPQVLTVHYEDIVLDYTREIERICDFICEPCVDQVRNWFANKTITTHSAWKDGARPLYQNSIGRWKHHKDNEVIQRFMRNDKAVFLLKVLGYL
jgi:hypothetical protein